MSIFKKTLRLLLLSAISLTAFSVSASVVDTKHNLSHWGPGTFKAVSESRVCIFCHTPHNSNPAGPLWSHKLSAATTFKKYSSPTLRILVDPDTRTSSGYDTSTITGATKLCLGCHDGLTALGAITTSRGSITIEMVGGIETLSGEESGYDEGAGTVNIQNKHPVSFDYDADLITKINTDTATPDYKGAVYALPSDATNGTVINLRVKEAVRRAGGKIECTICHDPHTNRATTNYTALLPFWVSSSIDDPSWLDPYEAVCASCHSQNYGEYTGFSDYTSLRDNP